MTKTKLFTKQQEKSCSGSDYAKDRQRDLDEKRQDLDEQDRQEQKDRELKKQ